MNQLSSHFEFLYNTNLNYDAVARYVVTEDIGRVSFDNPILSGRLSITEVIYMTDLCMISYVRTCKLTIICVYSVSLLIDVVEESSYISVIYIHAQQVRN